MREPDQRWELHVTGRVQGVAYRAGAAHQARALKLVGYVKNLEDGSVECVVEGAPEALLRFEAWCRRGPLLAQVADVVVKKGSAVGDRADFLISR